jgi:outer membrane protein
VLPAIGLMLDARAQDLKVGYTDHEILIMNMPKYATVQSQLQQEYQTGQTDLQTKAADIQQQAEQYQKRAELMTAEERQAKEQELMTAQQTLQQEAAQKEQALATRQAELMAPLWEEVGKAIEAVAQEKGLDLVMRFQIGADQPLILYSNPERVVDVTLDVARKLGIEVDETADDAAAATTPTPTPNQ